MTLGVRVLAAWAVFALVSAVDVLSGVALLAVVNVVVVRGGSFRGKCARGAVLARSLSGFVLVSIVTTGLTLARPGAAPHSCLARSAVIKRVVEMRLWWVVGGVRGEGVASFHNFIVSHLLLVVTDERTARATLAASQPRLVSIFATCADITAPILVGGVLASGTVFTLERAGTSLALGARRAEQLASSGYLNVRPFQDIVSAGVSDPAGKRGGGRLVLGWGRSVRGGGRGATHTHRGSHARGLSPP